MTTPIPDADTQVFISSYVDNDVTIGSRWRGAVEAAFRRARGRAARPKLGLRSIARPPTASQPCSRWSRWPLREHWRGGRDKIGESSMARPASVSKINKPRLRD